MPRFLGIDYGEKRIGLSWGDDLGVAMPLPAATAGREEERWSRIEEVIRDQRIDQVVVGYPYNMDGSVGFKAREVDRFVEALKTRFAGPVHLVDERLTSSVAEERYRRRKTKVDRKSGRVDSHAAALILQDFLDQRIE
jgi:putative holliday junction resolvase